MHELLLSFLFPCKRLLVVLLVSRSTFPYFLFLLHFLHFLILPILSRISSSKILLSMPASGPSSSVLPFTSIYPFLSNVLPFPPAFLYPVLSMFAPALPSQNPVEQARSRTLLERTSFPLPFPPVLPCIVEFTLIS